jgi:branched-chain amino acid transport system substrate-binding protein
MRRSGPDAVTWVVDLTTRAVDGSGCRGLPLEQRVLDYARSFPDLGVSVLSFYWRDRKGVLGQNVLELSPDGPFVLLGWNPSSLPGGLTSRELDVVTLLAAGCGNREIAGRIGASVRTVTTHVERVLQKWDVGSRTAAAVIAVQRGWLILPIPGGSEGCEALLAALLQTSEASARQDLRTGASAVCWAAPALMRREA